MTKHKSKYRQQLTELGKALHTAYDAMYNGYTEGFTYDDWRMVARFLDAAKTDRRFNRMLEDAPYFCGLQNRDPEDLHETVKEWLRDPDKTIRDLWERCADCTDDYGDALPMGYEPYTVMAADIDGDPTPSGELPSVKVHPVFAADEDEGAVMLDRDTRRPISHYPNGDWTIGEAAFSYAVFDETQEGWERKANDLLATDGLKLAAYHDDVYDLQPVGAEFTISKPEVTWQWPDDGHDEGGR